MLGPVVTLRSGSLRGTYVNVKGKQNGANAYLGVPFAKPPVGSLRLAPPVPAEPWEGERDATQQPKMCLQDAKMIEDLLKHASMQMDIPDISEDCLYLNIYVPAAAKENSKLPVMVWIHGGGLVLGAASIYDGSVLAAYQNVVVVGIQYRLGILGFFSTGDEHSPGNYGLLDQVAALQWVQENIHYFGGDPGLVTIFGESAGGVSVSLQVLSPLSSGLFHHAIAESGTAVMDTVLSPDPLPIAQIVGNMSGCDLTSPKTIVDCIMQLPAEDIINNSEKLNMVRFGVSTDGVFLPKAPEQLMKNHEFAKFLAPPGWVDGMDREEVLSILSVFRPKDTDPRITELILDEYLGTSGDRIANRDGYIELMGDLIFNIPAIRTANYHRGAPVYLYEFQLAPSILQKKRPSFTKSDHGDDIPFVFGMCFSDGHIKLEGEDVMCTEEEKQLALTVMEYWGNFARTGSPNGAGLVEWPLYGEREEYLGLGLQQRPGRKLKAKHFTFMTQTLPEKIQALQEEEHSE
ncbi:hypothetical protein JZ751_021029, partial [Albula glossodonta]